MFELRFCIAWAVLSSSSSSSSSLLHSQVGQLYYHHRRRQLPRCAGASTSVVPPVTRWSHQNSRRVPRRRRWQRLVHCPMSSSAVYGCRCKRSLLLLCDIVVDDQSRYRSRCSSLLRCDIGISYWRLGSSSRHHCLSGRICDQLLFQIARHDVFRGFVFWLCNVSLVFRTKRHDNLFVYDDDDDDDERIMDRCYLQPLVF